MAETEETKKKVKTPTALKRHRQDLKKNFNNRVWKSRVLKAKTAFTAASKEEKPALLKTLHSLLDKAAKNGIFKKNKVSRLKSRFTAKVS